MGVDIVWLEEPEHHDYPAAEEYLSLLFCKTDLKRVIKALRKADVEHFYAKDIFRAADILHPLGGENYHVKHNLEKIRLKKAMSPILLVKDSFRRHVIIADGFHRLCAVYLHSEDEKVPCKLVNLNQ
jgi:hypothetical protein